MALSVTLSVSQCCAWQEIELNVEDIEEAPIPSEVWSQGSKKMQSCNKRGLQLRPWATYVPVYGMYLFMRLCVRFDFELIFIVYNLI